MDTSGAQSPGNAPRVVVVGAGFGGLWAARALDGQGVSVRLIWRLLAVGELDRVNVGRCVRIPSESIDAFCAKGGAR